MVQFLENIVYMRSRAPRRHIRPHFLIVNQKSRRILLTKHKIRQGRRQVGAILQLGDAIGFVAHRGGGIQKNVPAKVGFLLELLDIEPIGFAVYFPVDMTDIIPRHILAMFGEFHREAMIRAFVQANDETLNYQSGFQLHTG